MDYAVYDNVEKKFLRAFINDNYQFVFNFDKGDIVSVPSLVITNSGWIGEHLLAIPWSQQEQFDEIGPDLNKAIPTVLLPVSIKR